MPDRTTPRLPYLPGLDGLRGIAVLAVLAYHLDVPGAGGGFLGVSLFFTLSGYLITSLLLVEHDWTGRVGLRSFWGRRARRLLPAALACLAGVVVVAQGIGGGTRLAGDVRAAVLDVANWRYLFDDRSYAALFDAPSPVLHFWSLSIEEQFYLLYPLVAAWALRRGRRRLGWVLVAATAASVGAQLAAGGSFDVVYYGTHTRAAELLAGGLLALALPPEVARRAGARGRRTLVVAGWAGLIALVGLWTTTDLGDAWLVRGGLVAVAALNVLVVAGAAGPGLGRLLAVRPLVAVGAISYGLYLFHWPVVVWLDRERTGLSGVPLGVVRVVVTVALAVACHRLLEVRFRNRRAVPAGTARLAALTTVATVLVATVGLSGQALRPSAAALASFAQVPEPVPTVLALEPAAAPGTSAAPAPPPPPVVWLVGDSVPYLLGRSLADDGAALGVRWVNLAIPSCDGARGHPRMRLALGDELEEPAACGRWEQDWPGLVAASPPDHVLVMLGATAVVDRSIGDRWVGPCDPAFADWYRSEAAARVDYLATATGARVHVVLPARADTAARGIVPEDVAARTACLVDIYRQVAATGPGRDRVDVVDLGSFVCPPAVERCRPLRADGLHYQQAAAVEVATWLLRQAGVGPRAGLTTRR